MANVAVIGIQWGDEGKGKIVDWLAEEADVVIRFQGGHNAGHTLVINGVTHKLSLLPSGIVRPNTLSLIGNGVVIDPWHLFREIETLESQGVHVTPEKLRIAENAALILPTHQRIDKLSEAGLGEGKIGTTGRGIGPAYEDKTGRRAIRVCDLAEPEALRQKVEALVTRHNILLTHYGEEPADAAAITAELQALAPKLLPYAEPVWRLIAKLQEQGKRLLYEGAQGALLDVDHGTYPFVTSSNTVAGAAATGSGSGPNSLHTVLGIVKAYTTRVGSGPFPTELQDETGRTLGERGHEFGTVTGRARRCGWFDAVLARQVAQICGVTELALTKLDVLDTLPELAICTGYEIDGKAYDYLPALPALQAKAKPVYETVPGWQSSTESVTHWGNLPDAARAYIRRLETLIGLPVTVISTSPAREATIVVKHPFQ